MREKSFTTHTHTTWQHNQIYKWYVFFFEFFSILSLSLSHMVLNYVIFEQEKMLD